MTSKTYSYQLDGESVTTRRRAAPWSDDELRRLRARVVGLEQENADRYPMTVSECNRRAYNTLTCKNVSPTREPARSERHSLDETTDRNRIRIVVKRE